MKYLFLMLLSLLALATHAQNPTSLIISGLVNQTLTVGSGDLTLLPVKTGGPLSVVSSSGQVRKTISSYKAVLLRDLLDKAGIRMANQKDKGKYYVVARATDGYTAIFAHNELYNNPTGQQTLVLFEEDGTPIGKDGPFVLFVTNDLVSGARHVKWLSQIEVRKVD